MSRGRGALQEAQLQTMWNEFDGACAHRRLSLRMISGELQINLENVSTTVHKHLHKRKICARFIPHSLSDERMETSGDFIDMCNRNPQFLETIITGCYQ